MLLEAIYHRSNDCWAYGYNERSVHVRIRTKRADIDKINVLYGDKCKPWGDMKVKQMELLAYDELYDYWQAEVDPPYGRLAYCFLLTKGEEQIWFTEKGFDKTMPKEHLGCFEFPYLHPIDLQSPPDWAKNAIFYQIFPERFANGDKSNDPEGIHEWGDKPEYRNFFGGDLQGVIDHLDYLADLGITVIYFNPIFEAPANHKYDTQDYMKIDPHFGTKETLKELVRSCHERGIRVILDGVFNHSGATWPQFQDVVKKGPDSAYYNWFHIQEWPLQVVDGIPTYKTFAFEKTMPKLNTSNPEVRDYFLQVGRYWIEETDMDGWRLDVANETDHTFWREFSKAVKEVKPDAYILGEVWHDGMKFLQGDQFHGVMNYPVSNAILDFFVFQHEDAHSFVSKLGRYLARYPQQVNEASFNHLDTHDTVRLLTLCENDKAKMKLAVAFQFTFIGAPSIYYGDEIGLDGQFDPDNRKCMIWEKQNQDLDLLTFYKKCIKLRKDHPALISGAFRVQSAEKGSSLLVYERQEGEDHLIVAMNASSSSSLVTVSLPDGVWKEADMVEDGFVSDQNYEGEYKAELGPYRFHILYKN
ncbi:Glycosidase [Fontibacillus panacisegetis]|uniref:Glycosidase n=1 Tax=Fontibacillus panacisegetis TaxID=670482 RepID=A0A1G7Q925_9BACL|nr:glycoside hydrolase family 13 protein [Fontibacillus panacisegetis]SDF94449.1 Glycosidase [Fontibacillus panacisegetis]